jgi:hypothetical protein
MGRGRVIAVELTESSRTGFGHIAIKSGVSATELIRGGLRPRTARSGFTCTPIGRGDRVRANEGGLAFACCADIATPGWELPRPELCAQRLDCTSNASRAHDRGEASESSAAALRSHSKRLG